MTIKNIIKVGLTPFSYSGHGGMFSYSEIEFKHHF